MGRALGEPGLKPTVRVGEAAIREVAAYLLDHDHFAGVPHTVLVKFTHPIFHVHSSKPPSPRPEQQDESDGYAPSQASLDSSLSMTSLIQAKHLGLDSNNGNDNGNGRRKSAESSSRRPSTESVRPERSKLGSLQEFVLHDCDTNEMGAALFSLQDVHHIAILDIRLFNTDRHAGNMLVQRPQGSGARLTALERLNQPQCRLLPIDHGFCLPEALEPPYFEWLHWPQVQHAFCPGFDRLIMTLIWHWWVVAPTMTALAAAQSTGNSCKSFSLQKVYLPSSWVEAHAELPFP